MTSEEEQRIDPAGWHRRRIHAFAGERGWSEPPPDLAEAVQAAVAAEPGFTLLGCWNVATDAFEPGPQWMLNIHVYAWHAGRRDVAKVGFYVSERAAQDSTAITDWAERMTRENLQKALAS